MWDRAELHTLLPEVRARAQDHQGSAHVTKVPLRCCSLGQDRPPLPAVPPSCRNALRCPGAGGPHPSLERGPNFNTWEAPRGFRIGEHRLHGAGVLLGLCGEEEVRGSSPGSLRQCSSSEEAGTDR